MADVISKTQSNNYKHTNFQTLLIIRNTVWNYIWTRTEDEYREF